MQKMQDQGNPQKNNKQEGEVTIETGNDKSTGEFTDYEEIK